MYEKSFQRPANYFKLSAERQCEIDSNLGILDWKGDNLTKEQKERFTSHYTKKRKCKRCGSNDGMKKHPCPYESEIRNNSENYCNCCDDCQLLCQHEI